MAAEKQVVAFLAFRRGKKDDYLSPQNVLPFSLWLGTEEEETDIKIHGVNVTLKVQYTRWMQKEIFYQDGPLLLSSQAQKENDREQMKRNETEASSLKMRDPYSHHLIRNEFCLCLMC